MPGRGTRVAGLLVAAAVLAVGAADAGAAIKRAPKPQTQVSRAFKDLVSHTRKTSLKSVSRRNRRALLKTAGRARKLAGRRPCTSVRLLRRYRRQARKVKIKRLRERGPGGGSARGRLIADSLRTQAALMALPRSKRCGGGRAAKVAEASSTVLGSSERRLRLRISLPPPTFTAHQVRGGDFLEMVMEGASQSNGTGRPGVPSLSKFFAVPDGANVRLRIGRAQGYTLDGVNLYPTQRQPVDQRRRRRPSLLIAPVPGAPPRADFDEPAFRINRAAYRSNRLFPSKAANARELGDMRALDIGGVDVSGGQYRARSKRLRVFTSIDVTVEFRGDNKGHFGPSNDVNSPWEIFFARNYSSVLENYGTVARRLGPAIDARFCGEEMLVITSPGLDSAAQTFAAAKRAQGYSTSVFHTGSGPGQIGSTNTDIQSFIRSRLNGACLLRPTYVVLLGNTAAVPTFLVPCGPGGDPDDCNIASDLPYSLNGIGTDLFADVMLGRIPATDAADADAVVNKIITYENNKPAPDGDDFYRHATTTAYFEPALMCVLNKDQTGTPNCDVDNPPVTGHWEIDYANHQDTRGFTITSERVNRSMRAQGYSVDRLYTTDDSSVIPEVYWNGTPIPAHLRRPTFDWDADTTDFFNAYNQGRFLILHRDHGWHDGWAEPTLHSGHVPFFTNGAKQPVVFGINCSSANFDTPARPSFVELQVRRIGGGAVAGFGDTRVSPSFPNNHMTLGFFDALFPNVVGDYGSPAETRRLGDVLIRGKQYMATQEGFEWHGAGDTYVEHYLYHLLGDPSMQMWADPPRVFDPARIVAEIRDYKINPNPGDPPFIVNVRFPIGGPDPPPFGTVVTLFQNGQAIGRGLVGPNGEASFAADTTTSPYGLTLAYQQQGVLPAQDSIDNQPPKQGTKVTLQGPPNGATYAGGGNNTFTGHLEPPFGGAKIRIVYTPEQGQRSQPEEHTVTTDAKGNYSDTMRFNPPTQTTPGDGGEWHAEAFFDGDSAHGPSSARIDFSVTD